jgi:signal transduction histidine kinase
VLSLFYYLKGYFVPLQAMKKISIRERLILYFVILSVISISIVSLFSIFEAKKGITNRTFSQLILLRDLRREQIITFFESRSKELISLSRSDEISKMAEFAGDEKGDARPDIYVCEDEHLLDLVSDSGFCQSLHYFSASGITFRLVYLNGNFAFQQVKELSDVAATFNSRYGASGEKPGQIVFEQIDYTGSMQIYTGVPVISKTGIYAGFLALQIIPDVIYRIIYEDTPGTGMGKTGEAYLAGSDGLMRSPSRFVKEAVLEVPVNTEGFKKASAGIEGVGIYKDYRGISVLGAYGSMNINGLSRIILAEIDSDEAMVPLTAIRNEILSVSLIIVLAIFIAALFVAYGITRPLTKLKNAANHIALGNYDQQLEVYVNDEIGELTSAFNAMVVEIRARKNMEAELAEERDKRIRAVIDGQDIERQRLSRELHDGLGQQLVAGKLILESSLYADDVNLKTKISEAQRIFDQIIGDIRRISHDLSPSILQEFGLKAAMENICNNMMKTSGIQVDFFIDLAEKTPDDTTSTYLFRIAQEGLNNIQRHSGATKAKVVLKADQSGILLEIEDNGCGFLAGDRTKRGGNGLYNIRERINILEGSLSIKSSPGKGTKIQVRIPAG